MNNCDNDLVSRPTVRSANYFPGDMTPPQSLEDLNKDQKDFIRDFLDKLPDRNDIAKEKIKNKCK